MWVLEIEGRPFLLALPLMATFGNTLFNWTDKKYYEKEKSDWTFKVKIKVIKSTILLNFCKKLFLKSDSYV